MSTLDVAWVRDQFPAFSEPSLKGQAFFENAGGSYTCRHVIDRLTRFYTQRKVQPYGDFEASKLGGAEMDEARAGLAAMMGISPQELSFGPSTTQNTYVLAQAFAELLQPGDAIIVTNQDHEANSGPWRRLADRGLEVREWAINAETGRLDIQDLSALLDDRARLVCFPHCSNIVGEINDVAAIVDVAHGAGALCCVDGVSYAPHGLPDVGTLGCDIYLFSTYKTYGPHQGVMVIRPELARRLPHQGHFFNAGTLTKRFTPAGPDHAQVAACAGIVDYFSAMARHHGLSSEPRKIGRETHDLMRVAEIALLAPVLSYLQSKNTVRLLGPSDAEVRAPTVALAPRSDPKHIASDLAKRGIMAGASDFYAVRCLQGMNEDPERGVLRLSFVHYTTADEVDHLLNVLEEVL